MTYPNPITVVSYQDGPQLTVNALLKDPTVIPKRLLDMTNDRFISDQLLRSGPPAGAGVVEFWASTPQFSMTTSAIVGEFGEIPIGINDLGQVQLAQTTKRGLGIRISREMADRNNVDAVNTQLRQVSNTLVRDWDAVFMAALLAAVSATGNTISASNAWTATNGTPFKDITNARQLVLGALLPGTTDNYLGYQPDTMVISMLDVPVLLQSSTLWSPYVGNVADANPQLTGQLKQQLFGLDVYPTWHLAQGTVLILERNTVGFISDEKPLEATPMEYHVSNQTWTSYTTRQSAIGIDNPQAVASITGVG